MILTFVVVYRHFYHYHYYYYQLENIKHIDGMVYINIFFPSCSFSSSSFCFERMRIEDVGNCGTTDRQSFEPNKMDIYRDIKGVSEIAKETLSEWMHGSMKKGNIQNMVQPETAWL